MLRTLRPLRSAKAVRASSDDESLCAPGRHAEDDQQPEAVVKGLESQPSVHRQPLIFWTFICAALVRPALWRRAPGVFSKLRSLLDNPHWEWLAVVLERPCSHYEERCQVIPIDKPSAKLFTLQAPRDVIDAFERSVISWNGDLAKAYPNVFHLDVVEWAACLVWAPGWPVHGVPGASARI